MDLRTKQGRSAMFKSKGERDAYLKKEVKEIEKSTAEKRAQVYTNASVCPMCCEGGLVCMPGNEHHWRSYATCAARSSRMHAR